MAKTFKAALSKTDLPKNHQQAREMARAFVWSSGKNIQAVRLAFAVFDISAEDQKAILQRWKKAGFPPLPQFAQYTAFCLEVEFYFYLAISNGIISDQRASNKVDIGYLYYLPFASVFVSNDKLHRASVPLFTEFDQTFVWGPELKKDLTTLNDRFQQLPEEQRAQGIFTLVKEPPRDHNGIVSMLWDKRDKDWRSQKERSVRDPEIGKEIVREGRKLLKAADGRPPEVYPPNFPSFDTVDRILIERRIPVHRGSWRIISEEVAEQDKV